MKRLLTVRAVHRLVAATLAIAAPLAFSGSASAAVPATPGIAWVWNYYAPEPIFGDTSYAYYGTTEFVSGELESLVPFIGHTVTVRLNPGKTGVVFDAPGTIVRKDPTIGNTCTGGMGIGRCPIDPRTATRPNGRCLTMVRGGLGGDIVTLRTLTGSPYCPRTESQVTTYRGNDVIDSHDGGLSFIHCGPGRDRVYAEAGDAPDTDCEAVYYG